MVSALLHASSATVTVASRGAFAPAAGPGLLACIPSPAFISGPGAVVKCAGRWNAQAFSMRRTIHVKRQGMESEPLRALGSCREWGEDVWAEQLNIRDLEEGRGRRQFYRTSCVFAPNKPGDLIDTLVASRGVSVVLDLRSLDEMKTDIESTFTSVVYDRKQPPSLAAVVEAAQQGKPVRYVVPLLERDFILPSLRKRLSLAKRLAFIWAGLTDSTREQELMVEEINKIGLGGLNELMLDGCGPEILWALQLMATLRQVPSAAVAVQCRLGKDRTGLISMLVKSTLGSSEEEMIADYKLSEGIDEIALGELQQRMEKAAAPGKPVLDRKIFSGADPRNIQTTLAWIKKNHGSIEKYLNHIGFDAEWRRKLKDLS